MWDLPGSGIEPVSPSLAGKFFTTEPPGKPLIVLNFNFRACKIRMLSTPRVFPEEPDREALYSRVAMKSKHQVSEHM